MNSETDSEVRDWKNKYHDQCKITDKLITEFKSLKLNEKERKAKLKKFVEDEECINSELSCSKIKLEEENDKIKKLNTDLTTKEQELCNGHKKLKYVCNWLKSELKNHKTELSNPNSHKEQLDKKENSEQNALPAKFKIVREKLRETKMAFGEVQDIIKNDIFNIKNIVEAITKLTEGEENNQYKILALKVQKLKEANEMKDEQLCRMENKVKELEHENDCNAIKINNQKKKLLESKWMIENVRLLETNCEQTNQEPNYFSLQAKLNNVYESLPATYFHCNKSNN